ncbi:Wadjet anti-phage system protein JetA family protein [Heliophilum fasciatum]|uniref:Uncharacterized protein n=1 Tax=Heliophilum fasciatum TaxID=35700 RepID=A0A4R2RL71_9FIRM|nr:Wadjet anti-phage system protein JetA family protein [Heliophilum fasciatum]MCW2278487.1 hypothetical protein [Heliophilum fasciatum]TCP63618.1 hypothetical protein EDD73_11743 [Heliophilum fasciatum]
MTNLFDVIPERFFLLFAGKNKQFYAEVLMILFEQYQIHHFGIQYEILRDLVQELLETQVEQGFVYEAEGDDGNAANTTSAESAADREKQQKHGNVAEAAASMFAEDTMRLQANGVLRRLRDQGWIDVEVRDGYRQYIVLPHYTSRLLAVFKDLCTVRTVEYQRYAFVTYQLLTGEEAKKRPAVAIIEAEEMTRQFIEELRVLINNMKHHMEQVVTKSSIQDVLDHHFDEYKTKIVDRSYHRLKTSDHVSRYRQAILTHVQDCLMDDHWMTKAVEEAVRSELFSSPEEAQERIRAALLHIDEGYRNLDDMLYQIDLRHNQYLRASFDRARYLTQHSHGIDQQLATILEWASVVLRQDEIDREELIEQRLQKLQGLFRLQRLGQLHEASLLPPRKRRQPHRPEEHVVIEVPEELRRQMKQQNLERMKKTITREKVRAYVLAQLGEREQMSIVELAPTTMEEFLYLHYVYLYGYDVQAGYRLARSSENRILAIGDYRFQERTVQRVKQSVKRLVR